MGSNLRDIRKRIASVKKTQKITSALKLVAASKFKRNQQLIGSLRDYSDELLGVMQNVLKRNVDVVHPFFSEKEGASLYVVITSDRGLCGGFNQNVFKMVRETLGNTGDVLLIGHKGTAFFKKNDCNVIYSIRDLSETLTIENVQPVLDLIIEKYMEGSYSSVFVISNEFKSAVSQNAVCRQILPFLKDDVDDDAKKGDYEYEPSADVMVDSVAKRYLLSELYKNLLESSTAEQGARMVAMDSATDNANELIYDLTLSFNRARQSAITTELSEIVAGAQGFN
jgi:F-type H+-transporting ATPase subunit gamma